MNFRQSSNKMDQNAKNKLALIFNEMIRAAEIFRSHPPTIETRRNFQNYVNLAATMYAKEFASYPYAAYILQKIANFASAPSINIDDFINCIDYLKWNEHSILNGSLPPPIISNTYLSQMSYEFYNLKK